jgi:hypothetical protein
MPRVCMSYRRFPWAATHRIPVLYVKIPLRFLLYTAKIAPEYDLALVRKRHPHSSPSTSRTNSGSSDAKVRDGVITGTGVFNPGCENHDYKDLTKAG